ncbi:hypothetical protein UlMin_008339 [Ulmus minor]
MGEIDTKPIESVQTALCLFGEKGDQRKNRLAGSDDCEKERELKSVLKDLANYKVQLEAKEAAYMQVLLKLEHSRETVEELSTLLKSSETERDRYMNELRDARARADELEWKMKETADQFFEATKIREQLSENLLSIEAELAAARGLELEALTKVELMETAAKIEREKFEELQKHVSELNGVIVMSKAAAAEAEKEKFSILSEKDAEIEVAKITVLRVQEKLEDMRRQLETMLELENQLFDKSIFVEVLQLQVKEADKQLRCSKKSASDAISDLKLLGEELEFEQRKNSSQEALIEAYKMEMNELKLDLQNANELASHLTVDVETLTGNLQMAKNESDEIREKETEAEVEIAMLKSELHKGRSKIAAAEAAEVRTECVKSGFYLAVQQLAVEAETAKKENQRLKQAAEDSVDEATTPELKNSSEDIEAQDSKEDIDAHITILRKEYESLIKKAEVSQIEVPLVENFKQLALYENKHEVENLRKELDVAMVKIGKLRNRAEQAASRAELAEKAKEALEDRLRNWREQRQKRKAALAALHEVSTTKEFHAPIDIIEKPSTYQPLFKVLNMKF